jgi:hypothetical protein
MRGSSMDGWGRRRWGSGRVREPGRKADSERGREMRKAERKKKRQSPKSIFVFFFKEWKKKKKTTHTHKHSNFFNWQEMFCLLKALLGWEIRKPQR